MIPVVAAQHAPLRGADLLGQLDAEVAEILTDHTEARLVVLPELHAVGDLAAGTRAQLLSVAQPLDGPFTQQAAVLARRHGVYLLPGSLAEQGPNGELFNTAVLLGPDGDLIAAYRKIFPWRPSEPFDPGTEFTLADVDGLRVGLSICYDAWFPEHTRQLAWLGAEAVLNVVRTTTSDRTQEVVLAQANAIFNQVYVVSVNAAGPIGAGRSLIVDPEGHVMSSVPGADRIALSDVLDPGAVARVRTHGTAALNRMWQQFRPDDAPLALPAYGGHIDPAHWDPSTRKEQ